MRSGWKFTTMILAVAVLACPIAAASASAVDAAAVVRADSPQVVQAVIVAPAYSHTVPTAPTGRRYPVELSLVALATARKTGGRKTAAKTAAATPTATPPRPGEPVPDSVTVVEPAPGSPAARKAADAARDAETARVAETGPNAPNPKHSENVKVSGKFDETVEGGSYVLPGGKRVDAEGRPAK